MIKIKKILIMTALGMVLTACQKSNPSRPADFSFVYQWDTGSLPPQYHYSYEVNVDPVGQGEFINQPGYSGENAAPEWNTIFSVKVNQLDDLYNLMLEKKIFRVEWAEGELLIGGSSSDLTINASGKQYRLPNDAGMITADRQSVQTVFEHIRSLVPQSIWDEIQIRQKEHESEAGNKK